MALFFDYKLQSPLSDPNYIFFEWHNTFPILAIASYSRSTTGQVHLHFEEVNIYKIKPSYYFLGKINSIYISNMKGEHDDAAVIQRASQPVNLIWHPKKKILITCWEGGEITTWNDNSKRLESFIGIHQTTVNSLCWSSNGTRLITGDIVSFKYKKICVLH